MRSPDSTSTIAELGSDRSTDTTLHLVWTLLAGNFCSMALGKSAQHDCGEGVEKLAMQWQLGHDRRVCVYVYAADNLQAMLSQPWQCWKCRGRSTGLHCPALRCWAIS